MATKKILQKNGKQDKSPRYVGNTVFIRGVTMYYTGRIVQLTKEEIVLEDAAWIPDTGRFSDALKTGIFNEVEPYPNGVSVERGSILDVSTWDHPLPRERK
jgi:hypothetical protein